MQQAVASMKRQADRHKLKLVSQSLPSKKGPKIAILNFCDGKTRDRLFAFNPVLIAYLPCRIVIYEDQLGIVWATAINLDLLLTTTPSPHPESRQSLAALSDALVAVMHAGANGRPSH
jgi:uncharacterized protein (DUF302 family)